MNDAAVGFQCPDCVKLGRKQTRQGRAAYGGARSSNPALSTIGLIGINVFVWLTIVLSGGGDSRIFRLFALSGEGSCQSRTRDNIYYPSLDSASACARGSRGDGEWFAGAADGAPWQLLTNAFSHVEIWHIAGNMIVLWVIGPQLEAVLGRLRFLAVYLISALSGSALVIWAAAPDTVTLGASGAIFGLLGALLIVSLKVGGDVRGVATWIGISVVFTFVAPFAISWQGHLGGLAGGLATTAAIVYAPKQRRGLVQAVAVGAITVALAGAIAVRLATL